MSTLDRRWNWTFWGFRTGPNQDVITDWYKERTPETRAKFDQRIRVLRNQPPQHWRRPWIDKLERQCEGLWEIRFKADRIQWRPLGFFGPGNGQFTILLFAKEKGNRFVPRLACQTALGLKAKVLMDHGRIRQYEPPE